MRFFFSEQPNFFSFWVGKKSKISGLDPPRWKQCQIESLVPPLTHTLFCFKKKKRAKPQM